MLSSMNDNFFDVLFSNGIGDIPVSSNDIPPIYATPAPDDTPPPIYAAPAPDNNPPPIYANPTPTSIIDSDSIISHSIVDITLIQIL